MPITDNYADDERLQTIAQLVHDRRIALGWSRRKLAFVAEVGQSTVNSIEDGERLPCAATLQKTAEALEVRIPR
ncbi:MAG TPA: helix-turn-helix transcriptional regulator [Chloroflexota bacterium]|nr:helix-turn-helix transcriptional regulator [Chloroflexota bacterium]